MTPYPSAAPIPLVLVVLGLLVVAMWWHDTAASSVRDFDHGAESLRDSKRHRRSRELRLRHNPGSRQAGGGKVVNVTAVQAPSDGYSAQVAQFALPELRREVLTAQSADIDVVSGASYDSQAYAESVQSALDRAHA